MATQANSVRSALPARAAGPGILPGEIGPKGDRPSGTRGRVAALVALAALALLAAGCGKTVIDPVKTEDAIEQNVEGSLGKTVSSVGCPSGVEVEQGRTFECTVRLAGGDEETARLRILNEDADVELVDLRPRGSGSGANG